ncbi:hypothetical protein [Nonomuraea sp. NPDC002799]
MLERGQHRDLVPPMNLWGIVCLWAGAGILKPSPEASAGDSFRMATPLDRVQRFGVFSALAGANVGVWIADPWIGSAMVAAQFSLGALVVITALYGSPTHSARAFRLLRWVSRR